MGIFSRNYERAGSGIAKNAPKKRGFFRYMEIFGQKFWKMIGLNFIYFLFFVPLIAFVVLLYEALLHGTALLWVATIVCLLLFFVLIGPATSGFTKILKNFFMEKPTFVTMDFFQTFKAEFKNSAIVGFIDCLIATCIIAAFSVYPTLIDDTGSKIYYVFFAITISIGIVVLMMNFYIFLLITTTNLSLKNILKDSLALAFVALKKNIIVLLVLVATAAIYVLVIFYVPLQYSMILLFLLPILPFAWLGLCNVQTCYPMIQKYIINPYYEQRGELNPEMPPETYDEEDEDVVFEDMGGKEKPIEPEKKPKSKTSKGGSAAKGHKGRVIS